MVQVFQRTIVFIYFEMTTIIFSEILKNGRNWNII